MRWEKCGWQLGRITDIVTNATPRVFKKFNHRIIWADGSKGPAKLSVENYGHGSDACYNSWTIVSRSIPVRCERVSGLRTCPLFTPHAARGFWFCHAVVLCLCQV